MHASIAELRRVENAYQEDEDNWTVATIYKEPNKIWLFASGGTRATSKDATKTTYTFKADRDVYFNNEKVAKRSYTVDIAKSDTLAIPVTWDGQDLVAPSQPKQTQALKANGAVQLSWGASAEKDVAGYVIYRVISGQKKAIELAVVKGREETTFLDRWVVDGRSYGYGIIAVDNAGNESKMSAPAVIDLSKP